MKPNKALPLILSLILALSLLAACGEKPQSDGASPVVEEFLKPSELVIQRQDEYTYPLLGLSFILEEPILEKMDSLEIAMLSSEELTEDNEISYAFLSWNLMTEEQKNLEISNIGTASLDWQNSLERLASLGMFEKSLEKKLDEITGCETHLKVGESADGQYLYFYSTNPKSDKDIIADIGATLFQIVPRAPFENASAFEDLGDSSSDSIGAFTANDIHGNEFSEKLFEENSLTMINVFATWCSPCVQEIPYLETLSKELKDEGFGIIGFVMDTVDSAGRLSDEGLELALTLAERTGATYPFLIPDSGFLSGRLYTVTAFPTTFFVDSEGNLVGEPVVGANSLEGWRETIEGLLETVKGK
ncbi:TlpA family protein disulfide reductase [Clostridiaceae bacterium OttesenSCG-928-D20]|nr:TlpA family protein disulfide reductase [Clostridiaceae bacterium OttesenSCG-928-D20]